MLEKLSKHHIRLICEVAASKLAALKQSGYLTITTADAMTKPEISRRISEMERIIVLKNTQLFSRTPENVLSSIARLL